MEKLKKALSILLDESIGIRERLEQLFPKNKSSYIKGLGRAIATPILMMVYPDKYGVLNKKSEAGLDKFGLLPDYKNESFADKHIKVNEILNKIANEHEITLFELDDVFGFMTG